MVFGNCVPQRFHTNRALTIGNSALQNILACQSRRGLISLKKLLKINSYLCTREEDITARGHQSADGNNFFHA